MRRLQEEYFCSSGCWPSCCCAAPGAKRLTIPSAPPIICFMARPTAAPDRAMHPIRNPLTPHGPSRHHNFPTRARLTRLARVPDAPEAQKQPHPTNERLNGDSRALFQVIGARRLLLIGSATARPQ